MKQLLLSKGFELTYCDVSKDNYWEYTDDNGDEGTSELAQLAGIDEERDIEYVTLQCKEDFTGCGACANDLYWTLTEDEFRDIVEKM